MPDASGSVDLGALSAEEQEALEQMAEQTGTEPGAQKVTMAFLVVQHTSGEYQVLPYDTDVQPLRDFTADDMYAAAAVVQKDVLAQETAMTTVQATMMQARAMQEQIQAQQLQTQLGNLRGGR